MGYYCPDCGKSDEDPVHVTRMAFVCVGCDFVYCDDPPSSCDCMQDPPKYIQGEINYFLENAKDLARRAQDSE